MLCLVLGINVEQDNKHERDKSTRVIVSNYFTSFDYIAFHLTTECVTVSIYIAFDCFVTLDCIHSTNLNLYTELKDAGILSGQ